MIAYYAYILFQAPRPLPAEEVAEVQAILDRLVTEYSHDFSSCQVQVKREHIPDPEDYEKVTLGMMLMLRLNEMREEVFEIYRVTLEGEGGKKDWVQVVWAGR